MTKAEVTALIGHLNLIFDIVRLVDVTLTTQISLEEDGTFRAEPYRCYAVWNKGQRCENCISAKAFAKKGRLTKFEFVGDDVYHVTAKYLEVEDRPFVLEMVVRVTDESLFGAFGQNRFVDAINKYNEKLYVDPLTGAYNRRYYEDQIRGLSKPLGLAMMDLDEFKPINDTWGHLVGDEALKAVVAAVRSCVRDTDAVVRYGGDEFLLVFPGITREAFGQRLEEIRANVCELTLAEAGNTRLSVSIGGRYTDDASEDPLRAADELLYQAKKQKNTVVIR